MDTIQITLNGKPHTLEKPLNVLELTQHLALLPTQVAIERNGEIVPRSRYGEVALCAGDQLEIVTFIGGG